MPPQLLSRIAGRALTPNKSQTFCLAASPCRKSILYATQRRLKLFTAAIDTLGVDIGPVRCGRLLSACRAGFGTMYSVGARICRT